MQKNRRKNYFVRYYKDFANTYRLRWCYEKNKNAKAKLEEEGFHRISKERALDLAYQETYRQRFDQSMGGYADDVVYPWNYGQFDEYDEPDECSGWKKYYRDGQIILPY